MSICIIRGAGNLCAACAEVAVPEFSSNNVLHVAIEVNDLCTPCMTKTTLYREVFDFEDTFRKVKRRSPWHRQFRWYNQLVKWVKWHTEAYALPFTISTVLATACLIWIVTVMVVKCVP